MADQLEQDNPQEPRAKKSTTIPDPPILTNGKDPRFDDWLLLMKQKLRANADHFDTIELQIAYVTSLIAGRAREHIMPRMRDELINKYLIIEDVFEYLKIIYSDLNRVVNA